MNGESFPRAEGLDLVERLSLQPSGPHRFRSRFGEANENGRTFGGQLLAQALMAGGRTAPEERLPAAMQFFFLQGALHDQTVEYRVTPLQEGKRFSSRNVRGVQEGGRFVCDAQVTFARALEAPAHMDAAPTGGWAAAAPESLPRLIDLPHELATSVEQTLDYQFKESDVFDLRVADAANGAFSLTPKPQLRFWIKARQELPSDPVVHAAVFAYLSDAWLNFTNCGVHVPRLKESKSHLYVASLNHAIWFHRPLRADQWLLFDCVSPSAAAGRGFTQAQVRDAHGVLVATATQESLMAPLAD